MWKSGQVYPFRYLRWVPVPVTVRDGWSEGEPVAEDDGEVVEGGLPAERSGAPFALDPDVPVAVDVASGDVPDARKSSFIAASSLVKCPLFLVIFRSW